MRPHFCLGFSVFRACCQVLNLWLICQFALARFCIRISPTATRFFFLDNASKPSLCYSVCVVLLTACANCVVDDTMVKLLPSIQWGSGVLGSAPVSGTLFFFCTSLTWPCWLVGKHQLSSFLWFDVPITPVTKIGFSGWDDSASFLNICSGAGDIHVIVWCEQIYLGKFCSGFAAVTGQDAELRRCLNIAVISAKGECTVKIKLANALSPALNIKASIPCHSIWTITLFCFLFVLLFSLCRYLSFYFAVGFSYPPVSWCSYLWLTGLQVSIICVLLCAVVGLNYARAKGFCYRYLLFACHCPTACSRSLELYIKFYNILVIAV